MNDDLNRSMRLTAMVLTCDEEANIGRTLDSVQWVDEILVVDSGSTDATLDIVARYPNARVVSRPFTTFAEQCNFGLEQVATPWVLSLDADYVFPAGAEGVVRGAVAASEAEAFSVCFDYAIQGKVVRGSILPPRTVIYRRNFATYENDGHSHRVLIDGSVAELPFRIIHDDRKPLSRWLAAQARYADQEAEKLLHLPQDQLSVADRIRRLCVVAPPLVFLLVYVFRGGLLSGWHGFYYALQRFLAELLLSISLIDRKLRV